MHLTEGKVLLWHYLHVPTEQLPRHREPYDRDLKMYWKFMSVWKVYNSFMLNLPIMPQSLELFHIRFQIDFTVLIFDLKNPKCSAILWDTGTAQVGQILAEVLNEVPYPNAYHFPATVLVTLVYNVVLSCQSLHKINTVMMQGGTHWHSNTTIEKVDVGKAFGFEIHFRSWHSFLGDHNCQIKLKQLNVKDFVGKKGWGASGRLRLLTTWL